MIYFETIDKFNSILGDKRPPGIAEHGKVLSWDNDTKLFVYTDITEAIVPVNTKLLDGLVSKGTDGAINYVWKLDANLNPAWRQEVTDVKLAGVARINGTNTVRFTMSDGSTHDLSLGSKAWDSVSDFTAGSDFQVLFNKSGVVTGEDAFQYDYITNQIKLTDTSGLLVKKTSVDSDFIKILDYLGAGVVELGDNIHIREAVKVGTYAGGQPEAGMIHYDGTKPQWYNGTAWVDFANTVDTFMSTIAQGSASDSTNDDYKLTFTLNDATTFVLQLGANAFNSKFIPVVSGIAGNLQLSDGAGNLTSSVNLTFLNDVLKLAGILEIVPTDPATHAGDNDGTIFTGTDDHIYAVMNGGNVRLDGITYTVNNLGAGKQVFKDITQTDDNNYIINQRTLIQGANVVLTETADGIQIDATAGVAGGEANIGSSIGDEIPVFKQKNGVALEFYTLKGGTDLDINLHNDVLTFNVTGAAANHYLNDISGDISVKVGSEIYSIANKPLGTKLVTFGREGIDNFEVEFGNNAFNSEVIRNLTKLTNKSELPLDVGTVDDKYKLHLEFNDTDNNSISKFDYQLGVNAFNSLNIPALVSGDPMVWTLGTKNLTSKITYKPDASNAATSELTVFDINFDGTLSYNEGTKTLGVVTSSNKFLSAVERVPATSNIKFTLNDASILTLTDLGDLAFLNTIPIATAGLLGGVIAGANVSIDAAGVISVAAPDSGTDISRLVSYDVDSGFSVGDKTQARTNIIAAHLNGHTDETFAADYLNLQRLLGATHVGWADWDLQATDLETGYHKLAALRVAGSQITSTYSAVGFRKMDSYSAVAANYLDFTVGDDGNIYWYSYMSGVKTKIMMLSPRTDSEAGEVYDLHVKGEIVEFSNAL